MKPLRSLLPLCLVLLAGCAHDTTRTTAASAAQAPVANAKPVKVGLALGGGAAKGFAHIGVIKMLQANGIQVDVVAGTSAGSVVGAMYASGMDAFQMQEKAVSLDQTSIRDVRLFSGGLVQGQKLQDYVNQQVGGRTIEHLGKPFAAVATRLEDGERTVFVRGNTGQAVRASSSVPGVFEPVTIGQYHYVDGGVVSPVPVDAARQLGAEFVIAVDISSKANGKNPGDLLGTVNQSLSIMGQRLGEAELKRADVVIRPKVLGIGAADFSQRDAAMMEGEKAALAALPQIRAGIAQLQAQRSSATRAAARQAADAAQRECLQKRSRLSKWMGRDGDCASAGD